jgi:hypothetical protein
MVKVGDIIDGNKRVTKVFTLCGSIAYQTEPVVGDAERYFATESLDNYSFKNNPPKPLKIPDIPKKPEPKAEEKPKRGRKKKED